MTLDSNTGEVITLEEAVQMVTEFKTRFPDQPKAYFTGSNNLKMMLEQENCIGIRFYNAVDPVTGLKTLVLVGVDNKQGDMTDGIILDKLGFCPPWCSADSPLNQ